MVCLKRTFWLFQQYYCKIGLCSTVKLDQDIRWICSCTIAVFHNFITICWNERYCSIIGSHWIVCLSAVVSVFFPQGDNKFGIIEALLHKHLIFCIACSANHLKMYLVFTFSRGLKFSMCPFLFYKMFLFMGSIGLFYFCIFQLEKQPPVLKFDM